MLKKCQVIYRNLTHGQLENQYLCTLHLFGFWAFWAIKYISGKAIEGIMDVSSV
jgi:hypothetical protein